MRRRTWEWAATGLGVAIWVLLQRSPHALTATAWGGGWALYVGGGMLVAATAFTLWARTVLGSMWSSAPSVKEGHELRTDGPYSITRHPIYTGMLGMVLGSVLVTGRWWAVAAFVLVTIYFLNKLQAEERLMAETFGERYAEYRRRTPRIVPGLRPTRGRGRRWHE